MGELHLEVLVDRMKREFGVEANVGRPQVSYRETVRGSVEKIEGKFVRQTGGSGQFGVVFIDLEPAPGEGFEFINKIKGGNIPSEYIPAVKKGIEEALDNGVKAGYPMVDMRVTLVDGKYHDVDSSEIAFKVAGSLAFKEAAKRAKPVLLEPIFAVEVVTPEDFLGDVIGDLSRRRGRVEGQERRGNALVVTAKVPLSEMFGYATDLRSNTQGRADVHDAVRGLRGGSAEHRREDRRTANGGTGPGLDGSGYAAGWQHAERTAEQAAVKEGRQLDRFLRFASTGRAYKSIQERTKSGEGEVRARQAARQRRDHRSHRPWQDDADRCHNDGAGRARRRGSAHLRGDRQRARGEGTRDHDRHFPRRVPDREPSLRPRRLPRPRRLRQEHDHRRRADGRRDPGGLRGRRPDAADARAHPARPPGRRPLHRRVPQQGRHGRRRGAARTGRGRGPRAALRVRLPGRRHPVHHRLGAEGARRRRGLQGRRSSSSPLRWTPTSRSPCASSTSRS